MSSGQRNRTESRGLALLLLPVLCCVGHAVLLAVGIGSVIAALTGAAGSAVVAAAGLLLVAAAMVVLLRRRRRPPATADLPDRRTRVPYGGAR